MRNLILIFSLLCCFGLQAQQAPRPEQAVRPGTNGQVLGTASGTVQWVTPTIPTASQITYGGNNVAQALDGRFTKGVVLDSIHNYADLTRAQALSALRDTAFAIRADFPTGGSGGGSTTNIAFDSNRPIRRVWTAGLVIGGDSITDMLEYLYYAPPTISLAQSPSTTVYERGTVNPLTYTSSTSNSSGATLTNGRIERGGTSVSTFGSATSGTYNFTFSPDAGSGNNATSYSFQSKQDYSGTENGTLSSNTRSIEAVYAVLYGVSSTQYQATGGIYAALNKLVATEGNKTVSLNGTGYIYYAFPATWSDTNLSKIVDGNGFDVTAAFTRYTRSVTTTGLTNNTTTTYVVYRSTELTSVNASFQFIR